MTNLDKDIADAVQVIAKAKVAEALGGDVLGKMIDTVMNHKDRDRYRNQEGLSEFDILVNDIIRETIRAAVRQHMKDNTETISAAVTAAFARNNTDKLVASIVDALACDDWRASLEVKIDRKAAEP